jgi:cytochrome c biogenesis protein CcmG, thiol:disulfide interchange protein DsbE
MHHISRKSVQIQQIRSKIVKQTKPVRKSPNAFLWIAVVTAVLLVGFYLFDGNTSKAEKGPVPTLPPNEITGAAPAFTLTDLSGKQVSLADFRGKVVVLDFWATWCPPCKKEIPDFIELQKQYGSRGVQILGIALDQPDKVSEFVQQNGVNYPILLGNDAITAKYGGIDGIPTTFVIDKQGRIVNRFEGFRPKSTFEGEIKKLL